MAIFRRKRRREREPAPATTPARPVVAPEDLVRLYLRGQNLEQIGRLDEAIESYEQAVSGAFDSAGPYDRLVMLYRSREAHGDVIRVVDAAMAAVRTFDQKRDWYLQMRADAEEAAAGGRADHTGPEF